VKFNLNT